MKIRKVVIAIAILSAQSAFAGGHPPASSPQAASSSSLAASYARGGAGGQGYGGSSSVSIDNSGGGSSRVAWYAWLLGAGAPGTNNTAIGRAPWAFGPIMGTHRDKLTQALCAAAYAQQSGNRELQAKADRVIGDAMDELGGDDPSGSASFGASHNGTQDSVNQFLPDF